MPQHLPVGSGDEIHLGDIDHIRAQEQAHLCDPYTALARQNNVDAKRQNKVYAMGLAYPIRRTRTGRT